MLGFMLANFELIFNEGSDAYTGKWYRLTELFQNIGSAGWHLIGRVGVFLALIDIIISAAVVFLKSTDVRARGEFKSRIISNAIVTFIFLNLIVVVATIQKAAGLDF